ncbi:MAG: hypothetical protein KBH07_08495, partial [Flavobacteriales bacterium]|nr:hypothetical protein [Flavobacteriales bacterium]
MRSVARTLPALSALWILLGCATDQVAPAPSGPVATHIAVQVDSAYIMAPNVVTPNADGVNDIFTVIAVNVVWMNSTVRRMNGDTAFHSTSPTPVWDELDSTDLGRYSVSIAALSTSGHHLSGHGFLDVLSYAGGPCLIYAGTPVTMDQFD